MTYDQHLQRSSHKFSSPVASGRERDDRFSWLLNLFGGWMLLAGAVSLLLIFVFVDVGKKPSSLSEAGPLGMLFLIYGIYGVLMGLGVLARLRVAWVLLVIGRTLGLLFQLLTLGIGSVSAMAEQLNGAAGSEFLSTSYFEAALSVAILIFLLGRKNWFYR